MIWTLLHLAQHRINGRYFYTQSHKFFNGSVEIKSAYPVEEVNLLLVLLQFYILCRHSSYIVTDNIHITDFYQP
jgi:hypothetical protein